MQKTTLLTFLFSLLFIISKGQDTTALAKKLDFFLTLKQKEDSLFYEKEKDKFNVAMTLGSALTARWNTITKNIEKDQGLALINKINSIGSDNALGFDFNQNIKGLIESNLTLAIANDKTKPTEVVERTKAKWQSVVGRILNNPITQSLLNSNPFTAIANSVIGSAVGFTTNQIDASASIKLVAADNIPNKYKDFKKVFKTSFKVSTDSINAIDKSTLALNDNDILNFANSIKPYIDLYDEMSSTTTIFKTRLNDLSNQYSGYNSLISTYDKKLIEYAKVQNISDVPRKIEELTKPKTMYGIILYRECIEKKELDSIRLQAEKYPSYKDVVNDLTGKYYDIHINYFTDYISILTKAQKSTNDKVTKFDTKKINTNIAELNKYLGVMNSAKTDLLASR